jgi:CRISPR-associated protein Cas5d
VRGLKRLKRLKLETIETNRKNLKEALENRLRAEIYRVEAKVTTKGQSMRVSDEKMIVHLKAWGDFACFTRQLMSVERVSYDVITPSAARGLLEAILYKPQFRWFIRRIAVKKPIRRISFFRNEVKHVLNPKHPEPLMADEDRTQRHTLALRDVEYVIEAELVLTPLAGLPRPDTSEEHGEDTLAKYLAMFQRRAGKGQQFTQPYFGCREFPAHFALAGESDMLVPVGTNPDTDLGRMLYDVFDLDVARDQKPGKVRKPNLCRTYFLASIQNGIMVIPTWREVKKQLEGAA